LDFAAWAEAAALPGFLAYVAELLQPCIPSAAGAANDVAVVALGQKLLLCNLMTYATSAWQQTHWK
jgi:hypothetical protein